jgi:uncharacterized protein YkwD
MSLPRHARISTRVARSPRLRLLVLAILTIIGSSLMAAVPAATATTPRHKVHRRHHRASAASACTGAGDRVGTASPQVLRSAVVCLINQDRAAHHLPPLHASPLLDRSAQGWTNVMVSSDQFTHGTNFASRISAAGYVWRAAGENIATGFATPRAVVRAWMASTGHCQNILNPTYRNVGTGVSTRPVRGYATGAGTWTQDFALGMNQSPPSGNTAPMDGCPY